MAEYIEKLKEQYEQMKSVAEKAINKLEEINNQIIELLKIVTKKG